MSNSFFKSYSKVSSNLAGAVSHLPSRLSFILVDTLCMNNSSCHAYSLKSYWYSVFIKRSLLYGSGW